MRPQGLLRVLPLAHMVMAVGVLGWVLLAGQLLISMRRSVYPDLKQLNWSTACQGGSAAATANSSARARLGAVFNAPAGSTSPQTTSFTFPRLIHQTVRDKARISCQEKAAIDSWRRLNPSYRHILWDDGELRTFMLRYYPELVPMPYDLLLSGAERSDLWRVLVLHKLGGVYADVDVQALQPIDTWNDEHGHDAAVLLGVENYDAERTSSPLHVVNWALAATPGHPLLARLPGVVARAAARQFLELAASQSKLLSADVYESGIIDRTGPAALSRAMYEHFEEASGIHPGDLSYDANVTSPAGLLVDAVRVLPMPAMAGSWQVAAARSRDPAASNITSCDDVARAHPEALLCHMYHGTWRRSWSFPAARTYTDC